METLADVSLERFTKIANEEGWSDDAKIKEFWLARPLWAPFIERVLRETFREFIGVD